MCGSYFGSLSQISMEGGTVIPPQGMVMQPFVMPMFYCAPAGFGSLPQEAFTYSTAHVKPDPERAPEETIEKPHCESDADEVYYHLALAYNNPGEWRAVEDSLFIRATKLPTIEQCYFEKPEGVYLPWGPWPQTVKVCSAGFPWVLCTLALSRCKRASLTKVSLLHAHAD